MQLGEHVKPVAIIRQKLTGSYLLSPDDAVKLGFSNEARWVDNPAQATTYSIDEVSDTVKMVKAVRKLNTNNEELEVMEIDFYGYKVGIVLCTITGETGELKNEIT